MEDFMKAFEFDGVRLEELQDRAIYNLMTEEEISKKEILDKAWLNEGSADVEEIDTLLTQAENYFKSPNYYPLEEDKKPEFVTGFISIYNGESHTPNGVEVIWKSTKESIRLDVNDLSVENVKYALRNLGISFSDLIRVVFYGPALRHLVGSSIYEKDDRKSLLPIDSDHQTILLAIPDHSQVSLFDDDSIYTSLNSLVRDELKYGKLPCEALDRFSFTHWSITKEFYENRLNVMRDRSEELRHLEKLGVLKSKKDSMSNHFKDAVEAIDQLNTGVISICDVRDNCDAHYINKILYVARSNVFKQRISNKFTYFQLIALSKKLMIHSKPEAA
jgi:hypothetical protein